MNLGTRQLVYFDFYVTPNYHHQQVSLTTLIHLTYILHMNKVAVFLKKEKIFWTIAEKCEITG